ncbi:MAG: YfiR family protein [bacterium]|nr:YfiR family protein [bacterium]
MNMKIGWALLVLTIFALESYPQEDEYIIKAIYFEKFARFITWPEPSEKSKHFVLGVIGENPFGPILENVYSTRKIKAKKVKFKYFLSYKDITDCHILFISASYMKDLTRIREIVTGKPILIVGDVRGFTGRGVHISFFKSAKKFRFEIAPSAMQRVSLSVDSLLLGIADVVDPGEANQ